MPKREAYVFTDHTTPRSCPVCQRVLNAQTGVSVDPGEHQPRPDPGDITLCAYCHTILVYTIDSFRIATDHDLARLDPELRQLLLAVIAEGDRLP